MYTSANIELDTYLANFLYDFKKLLKIALFYISANRLYHEFIKERIK